MSKNLFDLIPEPKPGLSTEEQEVHATGQELAAEIIGSEEWRLSIKRRLNNDALPPAVELYFLQSLFGKITERKEITFPEGIPDLTTLSDEELEIRIEKARQRARALRNARELADDVMTKVTSQ